MSSVQRFLPFALIALTFGCGGDDSESATGDVDASAATCPGGYDIRDGLACSSEGLTCWSTATCWWGEEQWEEYVCTDGAFERTGSHNNLSDCSDPPDVGDAGDAGDIDAADVDAPDVPEPDPTCPGGDDIRDGMACSTEGLTCWSTAMCSWGEEQWEEYACTDGTFERTGSHNNLSGCNDPPDAGDAGDAWDAGDADDAGDAGDVDASDTPDPGDVGLDTADTGTGDATGLEAACIDSGGVVTSSFCCASAEPFPDLCGVGACSCPPGSSIELAVCDCGEGRCFDGTACVAL